MYMTDEQLAEVQQKMVQLAFLRFSVEKTTVGDCNLACYLVQV
jgi:hypothetical protein